MSNACIHDASCIADTFRKREIRAYRKVVNGVEISWCQAHKTYTHLTIRSFGHK